MGEGGAIVLVSYLGSTRVIPNYNVMGVAKASLEASVRYLAADLGPQGVRVNAVSAGPIKTLAVSGISGFGGMQRQHRNRAPLGKDTGVDDAALFMLSPMPRGITGQVRHVDGGFCTMGDQAAVRPSGPALLDEGLFRFQQIPAPLHHEPGRYPGIDAERLAILVDQA
jgi:enoyl-[acyl-carrier protein] reductase I